MLSLEINIHGNEITKATINNPGKQYLSSTSGPAIIEAITRKLGIRANGILERLFFAYLLNAKQRMNKGT